MSAHIETVVLHQWVCDDCLESGPLTIHPEQAAAQGNVHDAAVHDPHDRDDDA